MTNKEISVMQRRTFFKTALALAVSQHMGSAAFAQSSSSYPASPISLIVPYPPGGSSDLMCRLLAEKMTELFGESVIIENRAGGSGSIGTSHAVRQAADGHTILFGNVGPMVISPLLLDLPYNIERDLDAVTLIATGSNVLVVNSKRPEKNLKEFLETARKNPNTLTYGSGGYGTLAHLGGEMLNRSAKVDILHVPYKGGIQSINDLMGEQIDMVVSESLPVMSHIESGRLRPLAVTGEKRMPQLPDVPTFLELGFDDIIALNSWGLYTPAGVPKDIAEKLHSVISEALLDSKVVDNFYDMGVEAMSSSPEALLEFNAAERRKYADLISEQNIRIQS